MMDNNLISAKSVVNNRITICSIHLFVSTVLYCLVCIFDLDRTFGLMEIYGYYSFIVFAILLLSELRLEGLNLILFFCVGALFRLVLPTFQMAQEAEGGIAFDFYKNPTNYLFQCSIAMNIYYMMFVLGLTKFSKDKSLQLNLSALFRIKHIDIYMLIIYIVGALVRLIPAAITFADTLRRFVSHFPTLALLILAFYCAYNDDKSSKTLFKALIIIELIIAIFLGFFKGAILMPLLIYILYYYLYCRKKKKLVLYAKLVGYVLLTLFFLLNFVYPFIMIKRSVSQWDPATNLTFSDYDNFEIIEKVIKGDGKENALGDETAEDAASSRQNAIPFNAYFYMSAVTDGYKSRFLESAFIIPIPRWLGGESRVEDGQGYLADAYLNYGDFAVSKYGTHNAVYVGQFASAFFWGGWIAAVIMCFFNAWVIAKLFAFSFANFKNAFALLLLLQIVVGALSCYEEIEDGGISRAINWGVVFILALFWNLFASFLKQLKSQLC